jgi:leader peptidase (prepilin peptidase)/N-methyltransferase
VLDLLAASPAAFTVTALVLGLIVGSFLNVVIHRLPIMLDRQWRQECAQLAPMVGASGHAAVAEPPFNLIVPRSSCPQCKTPISPLHNIPVFSYLALRGRCASCSTRISARYPAVELLCGLMTATVAWQMGVGWPTLCAMIITWLLIALAFIDLDHQLLPDSLTLLLLWLGLAASLTPWAADGRSLPVPPASAIAGAALGYLSLWSIYHLFRLLTGKEGMGYGDFKLLGALGAWLGWQMLLPIVLLSACVGAIVGLGLILAHRQQRGHPMPFGPFLAVSGWIAMLWGPQLVARYLGLFARSGG